MTLFLKLSVYNIIHISLWNKNYTSHIWKIKQIKKCTEQFCKHAREQFAQIQFKGGGGVQLFWAPCYLQRENTMALKGDRLLIYYIAYHVTFLRSNITHPNDSLCLSGSHSNPYIPPVALQ